MEDMPPAVALPFRIRNSLREEVARLQLMTDPASTMLPDPMADHVPAEQEEVAQVVVMEEGGDGDEVQDRTVRGSEEEDSFSVGPEPSVVSSISDSSRIASASDEFWSLDPSSETGSPCFVAGPALTANVGVLLPAAEPEVQGGRAGASGGGRSVFLKNYVPLWGCVSICGRRPEMEDAVVVVPRFFEIPFRMLTNDGVVDGMDPSLISLPAHFFGVYDGHGGSQVIQFLFPLFLGSIC